MHTPTHADAHGRTPTFTDCLQLGCLLSVHGGFGLCEPLTDQHTRPHSHGESNVPQRLLSGSVGVLCVERLFVSLCLRVLGCGCVCVRVSGCGCVGLHGRYLSCCICLWLRLSLVACVVTCVFVCVHTALTFTQTNGILSKNNLMKP